MTVSNAHEKVIQIVRMKGPVLPSQINKELETNIIFASAILSELVDKKTIRISRIKVGGSPLYYYPGQEHKLQQYADKLPGREKEAYEIIREKKVIKDDQMPPAIRVALRELRDFAKPLQVNVDGKQQIFWKWYLLPNNEVEVMIKNILGIKEPSKEAPKEIPKEVHKPKPVEAPKPEVKPEPESAEPKPQPTHHKPEPKPTVKEEKPQPTPKEEQQTELDSEFDVPKDKFFRKVKKYCDDSRIKILDGKVIRKESDFELTVTIPSTVGTLTYFVKAKNKKKINDGDLSSIYINAQSKKMPVLFLTTGELTKKAKELLEKEFKNMGVKKI